MSRIVFIMILSVEFLLAFKAHKIEPDFVQNGDYMGIRILDSKVLDSVKIDGLKFCEISDIAYDKKRSILYALSDKARLFQLSLVIEDKKIKSLTPLKGEVLRNLDDKKLLRPYKDSEGMALVGDEIWISFENRVRVTRYDQNLHALKNIPLPYELRNPQHYRGKNKGLEALTYSAKHGIITTAEYPLRAQKRGFHTLYDAKGKLCTLKTAPDNAITEMEMMPDGNLLLLQRKFQLRTFSFETTLLKVNLDSAKEGMCESKVLAWMSTKQGWNIDNYEGLTHLWDNLYLMISDNNNNHFEKTILTLFEIKE